MEDIYPGPCPRCFRSLVLAVFLTMSADSGVTSASISSDVVVSSNLCTRLPEYHQSYISAFIPSSFAILLSGQSPALSAPPTLRPQPKEPTSALGFWTHNQDEQLDENLKKGVLSNDGGLAADDGGNDDISSSSFLNNSTVESSYDDNDSVVSAEYNHSQHTAEFNTTHDKIDNNTNSVSSIPIDNDDNNSTTQKSKSSWWVHRLSSIPGVLPGRPLFMRLVPFKSSEIISKMIEEVPVQTNVQIEIDGIAPPPPIEYKQMDEVGPLEDDMADEIGNDAQQTSEIAPLPSPATTTPTENANTVELEHPKQSKRRRFFQRRPKSDKRDNNIKTTVITKEELKCPAVVTNIHDLQSAVLINEYPLRDIGFRFPVKGLGSDIVLGGQGSDDGNVTAANENADGQRSPGKETIFMRDDPIINGSLSSLLTYEARSSSDPYMLAKYQQGIELINLHPVLSIVRERVKTKSKPGDRVQSSTSSGDDIPHLALVIEGGGMRGAVSAGMAAALSTLDLLDAFDSVHGSSAGAIIGAYIVSRQLSVDIYTDIMPAAGSRFASKRRGMINFGADYLSDLIQRKYFEEESESEDPAADGICIADDESLEDIKGENATSWWCEDDDLSSVELAMMGEGVSSSTRTPIKVSSSGLLFESANYLFSNTISLAKKTVSKPLSFAAKRFGRALGPALTALDFATSMRQYLRKRPGMNLTYVLDGVMDETHGLRPFDLDAFQANDKRQPLYIVASTVNLGNGEMETVAFNSKDGDFFGLVEETDAESLNKEGGTWRLIWSMFKFVPYTIFSSVRRALSTDYERGSVKDTIEADCVPPGTNAMYGFAHRQKIRQLRRQLNRPQEEKLYDPTGRINDEGKKGIFPCLEASMLVPGAAGPPIQLIRSQNRKFIEQGNRFPRFRPRKEMNRRKESNSHLCCDAFAYEPIPYRSAVEKAGATHVLAIRSRPDGCVVETKQHTYERVVGPVYFRNNGMNQVAKLFSSGGSQYRYIEDVFTLDEGLARGIAMGRNNTSYLGTPAENGVKVPPTQLFYDGNAEFSPDFVVDTDDWKRAHLLPITLPYGSPELPALSQDKDEVLRAVRNGYAAAFDVLAPVAGLSFDSSTISGDKVAKLLFPDGDDDVAILNKPVKVKPSYIGDDEEESKRRSFAAWITRKREARRKAIVEIQEHPDGLLARKVQRRTSSFHESDQYVRDDSNTLEYIETEALLAALPGFRGGRLDHIADNLLRVQEKEELGANTSASD